MYWIVCIGSYGYANLFFPVLKLIFKSMILNLEMFSYWTHRLGNFQLWTVFLLSLWLLFIALSWSVLFMISIDFSFIKVCSIYKNICFSWLDFIFGIIFNCWLEYLMILIIVLCLPLMILFEFNNIIKVINELYLRASIII